MGINIVQRIFSRFAFNLISFFLLLIVVYICYYYSPGQRNFRYNNRFFYSFKILIKYPLKQLLFPEQTELTSQSTNKTALEDGKGQLINPSALKVTYSPWKLGDRIFEAEIKIWDPDKPRYRIETKVRQIITGEIVLLSRELPDEMLNTPLQFYITPVNYAEIVERLLPSFYNSAVLVTGTIGLILLVSFLFIWLELKYSQIKAITLTIRTINFFSGVHLIVWSLVVIITTKHFRDLSVWMIAILAYGNSMFSYFYNSLKEEINRFLEEDYLLAVKARGGSPLRNFYKEILIIFVTLISSKLPIIISGTIIVEYMFSYPGLGWEIIHSIKSMNINMIMAISMSAGAVIIVVNSLSEMAQNILDPRLRAS